VAVVYKVSKATSLSLHKTKSLPQQRVCWRFKNIEDIKTVFAKCAALCAGRPLCYGVNHPTFRVLKKSSWGYDEKLKVQYRRVDAYLSAAKFQ